jgi:hypothetical protein
MVLLGLGAVLAVLVLGRLTCRARRAARKRRRWFEPPSQTQWDAALRALAYAGPGYPYSFPVLDQHVVSDEELCQAWCSSCRKVRAAGTARELRLAVEERRACLDELERRHPRAVAAWLVEGAAADEDPLPYLSRWSEDHHEQDQ